MNRRLEWHDGGAVSPVTGEWRPARALRCSCGASGFRIFGIVDADELHFECLGCLTSYCPAGKCAGQAAPMEPLR